MITKTLIKFIIHKFRMKGLKKLLLGISLSQVVKIDIENLLIFF